MNETYQSSITVKTKDELQQAKNEAYEKIIVIGDLADKLKRAKKITKLSTTALGILTALLGVAIVATPQIEGISYFAVMAPIAAVSGLKIAVIAAAVFIGIGFIIAIFKEYKEISFKKGEIILAKK